MFSFIKNFFQSNRKDNFLIVTFLENKIESVILRVDFINKDLIVEKVFTQELPGIFSSKDITPDFLNYLRKIFSNVFYPKAYKVIFVFGSKLAMTNFGSVNVLRDNHHEIITEANLENLISQATFNFFGPSRKCASNRLNTSELETIICDVRIYDVLLDKHPSIDFLKEKGKTLEFYLSETFCHRDFLKKIISLLPTRARLVFVTEGGSILTHLVSRLIDKPFLFARVGINETNLFFKTKTGEIGYLDSFKWGKENLYMALAKELNISTDVAKSILMRYLEDKTSISFAKKFNILIKNELALLSKGLELMKSKAKIRFLALELEPALIKDLKLKNISSKSLVPIDFKTILDYFNFQINSKMELYGLAALLEAYFTPQEDLINKLARRRMRWLIP